jgi:RNA polymerase sigma-70 factor (ECF subfamily)
MDTNTNEALAASFEVHRSRLRGVAYRMLGSLSEADDAVQDAWIRLSRSDAHEIDDLAAWLTTVVARICLNMLRSRKARREEPIERLPDPVITEGELQPDEEALLAESVGLALQVVLETLSPAERLAFVLHDMFDLPFNEIAAIAGRTPEAARQLASRARRRVQDADVPVPDRDIGRQRRAVEAFFSAARAGDLDGLVAVLDPDVILRTDTPRRTKAVPAEVRGAAAVARQATLGAGLGAELQPVLVNGVAGAVVRKDGRPVALMAFTVVDDKIVAIDAMVDPHRIGQILARAN